MMTKQKPNFIVFCTDQQRADHLGCAGHAVLKTPNIDRIAEEGVLFRSCYTSCPACLPARATMFTGLTNRASGVRANGVSLPEDIQTMPGLLAQAGYRTHAVGKLHLKTWGGLGTAARPNVETAEENPERIIHWANGTITRSPDNYYGIQTQDSAIGHVDYIAGDYKVWLDEHHPGAYAKYSNSNPGCLDIDPDIHYNNWIADRAIDFINARQDPFFLWCSFPDPHEPFAAVRKWADFYRDKEIEVARTAIEIPANGSSETLKAMGRGTQAMDENYLRECTLQTYGMISHVDEQVGRVLDTLAANGMDNNTVVIFTADHGEQLGEHGFMHKGFYPHDAHARIPFLCKVPWSSEPGRIVDDVVSMLDFVPTLLDLAEIDQPEDPNIDESYRKSCTPLPSSLPGESLKPVLLEGKTPQRKNALLEFDDEWVKPYDLLQMRTLVTNDYKLVFYSPTQEILLFDRKNDPEEENNLAGVSEYAQTKEELLKQLLNEISRTENRLPRRIDGA